MDPSQKMKGFWPLVFDFSKWSFYFQFETKAGKRSTRICLLWKLTVGQINMLGPMGVPLLHTVSFDWFLSGLEWILNLEFCLLKLLIFYQKLLWHIRSRLNSSTFWVFRPVFRYVWSKLKLCAQKKIQGQTLKMRNS